MSYTHAFLRMRASYNKYQDSHISGVNRANQWAIRVMRRAHPLRKRGNFQQIRRILMKSDGASANYNARREVVILRILSAHLLGCFCKKEKKKKRSRKTRHGTKLHESVAILVLPRTPPSPWRLLASGSMKGANRCLTGAPRIDGSAARCRAVRGTLVPNQMRAVIAIKKATRGLHGLD